MHSKDKFKTFWWQSDKKQVSDFVFDAISYVDENQAYRGSSDLRHLRLYSNAPILGLGNSTYARAPSSGVGSTNRLALNIVHSMISTIVSKIMKNRPRPMFLTSGGDYTMKRRAKLLNKFVQGLFYGTDMYEVGTAACLDSCIFGTGFIKILEEDGEVRAERVFPYEILVDDAEAIYGKPRQIFQRKVVNREVLISHFPEFEKEIRNAQEVDNMTGYQGVPVFDQVTVIEAWHLPSSRDSKDGRHVMCVSNACLVDEAYTRQYFPFVSLRWSERALGFWGQGIAEQLTGLQIEINKLLKTIQVAMNLISVPKIFIERGSKVSKSHLNNEIGGIIEYAGTPPIYKTAQAINPEMFNHLERLYTKAYEIIGVSQLSAASRKPTGLDSGRALREFSDIESERFLSFARSYEKMYLDAAKIMVNMARDLHEEGHKDFSVTSFTKSTMQEIAWSDINLKENQYIMQVFPTSLLPVTPAARLQTVEEMMRTGLLSREDGLALLDFPDLEGVQSLETAAIDEIERVIENIIENGEYTTPEPFTNLGLAMKKMNQAYIRAKLDNVPEEKLELMRRYVADAQGLITQAREAEQQQMMMMQMQQQAMQQQQQQTAPQVQSTMSAQATPGLPS